jgi:hypothetical protein
MSDKWIYVGDRLPITEDEMKGTSYKDCGVIIATKHFVTYDRFEAGNTHGFWCQFGEYKKEVTHWMPYPESPGVLACSDKKQINKFIDLCDNLDNTCQGNGMDDMISVGRSQYIALINYANELRGE